MATPRIAPTQAQTTPAPQDNHRSPTELRASQSIRQFILSTERVVDHYYNDQAGNCTFGAGSLAHMGQCTPAESSVAHLSEEQIERPLEKGIAAAEEGVWRNVKVPLTQAQFDALVSITYNAGPGTQHTPNREAAALPSHQRARARSRRTLYPTHSHPREGTRRKKQSHRHKGVERPGKPPNERTQHLPR